MDEMTPCKRIKLDPEAKVEGDNKDTDDSSDMIKRKKIRVELINGQQEGTTMNEKHLNDVHRKEDRTCIDHGKDELTKGKEDSQMNLQDERGIQDGEFGKEPPPSHNSIEKEQYIDLDSNKTTPPKKGQRQKSTSAADESDSSVQDEPLDSEIDQLREFQVLDEVADDEKKDSDDNFSDSESDRELGDGEGEILDIPDDEIEQMLEENLPEDFKGQPKQKPRPYGQRKKLVLEEKGINHFEVLPLDWIVVRHMSGMPIYLHRPTRVCTFAKPYFLGKASARKHEIPISAIPCLNYRRALEEEIKQNGVGSTNTVDLTNETVIPKSDTTTLNGETENVISEESSSSKCPFAKEQINSNAESISQENSNFGGDTISTNSSEENTRHNFIESSNVSTNSDIGDGNESLSTKIVNGINNDSNSSNLTPTLVTNVSDREMNDDNVASIEKKPDSIENSCNIEGVVNGNTEVSSSTNLIVASSENNVDSTENKNNTRTSDDDNINETYSNPANKDAITKPVGIAANITVIGNQKVLPGGIILPNVKIETANPENWKNQHLAHEKVTEYCKKLFHFRTINILRFVQWSDRRKYAIAKKTLQRPTLPEGTKLITIPAQPAGSGNTGLSGRPGQKEWVMNPNGRSYVCIFHEYVQRALQKKPTYECVQLENAATPYKVTVYLNGMQYGVGYGTSKRQAKSMAAKASIEVLIPEMRDEVTEDSKIDGVACRSDNPDFAFFDFVTIDDPRIAEFCAKTMEPSPHAILHTCLLRNFGVGSQEIKYETKPLKRQRIEFTMTVGKHTATVVCKKKKDGKQRAAQAILQALHPHIKSWGSLLRLYGSRSLKSFKEKKIEEQEITLLQGKAMVNMPNYAILNKLKAEMERLRERDTAVVPIGTLIVTDSLPTHSGSNLDNVEI